MFDPTAQWDERRVMERFREEMLPILKRYGPEIGEKAMQGDLAAERIVMRYNCFASWVDPLNYRKLGALLKDWLKANGK